jgi:serine/threonine protein kinase
MDTGGTPAFLAPEVILGKGDIDFKTDVWSLGVLIYLLAYGTVPFEA